MRDLTRKRLQVDEIWAFVYAMAKNAPTAKKAPADAVIFACGCDRCRTKLIPSFHVGSRDADAAAQFTGALALGWPTGCDRPATATGPTRKPWSGLSVRISTTDCPGSQVCNFGAILRSKLAGTRLELTLRSWLVP